MLTHVSWCDLIELSYSNSGYCVTQAINVTSYEIYRAHVWTPYSYARQGSSFLRLKRKNIEIGEAKEWIKIREEKERKRERQREGGESLEGRRYQHVKRNLVCRRSVEKLWEGGREEERGWFARARKWY